MTRTFFASVLNRSPFFCTTVIVRWPVLPTFKSWTMPDLPLCMPPVTWQASPSLGGREFVVTAAIKRPGRRARHFRPGPPASSRPTPGIGNATDRSRASRWRMRPGERASTRGGARAWPAPIAGHARCGWRATPEGSARGPRGRCRGSAARSRRRRNTDTTR